MAEVAYLKQVLISTAQSGTYVPVDCISDASFKLGGETFDITYYSTAPGGFHQRQTGLLDPSITLNGDYSTAAGQLHCSSAKLGRTSVWIKYLPTGSSDGAGFQTSYIVDSFELTGAVDGKETVSIGLLGNSTSLDIV